MKLGLLPRILLAIALGTLLGLVLPDPVLAVTESIKVLFSGLLRFFVPLLVLAFIGAGIADLRGKIGRLLGTSVLLAWVDTVLAIGLAVTVASLIIPAITDTGASTQQTGGVPDPFFVLQIDPPLAILSAMLLAFILGVGATWDKSTVIRAGLIQFRDIVMWCIQSVMLPVIPFFIGLVFIGLAADGKIFGNIPVFLGTFVLIIVLQWVWLAIEYTVAWIVSASSPFPMIKAMLPAYVTGMGTMSSAVTMPVALRGAQSVKSIDAEITSFTIPLFNTLHQSASGIGIATGAITVLMLTTGSLPGVGVLVGFVLVLSVIQVGAVGVPGGSILAAVGVLQSTLGFGDAQIALMFTLFAIQDSFATAGNVTGDGALTMIINRFFGKGRSVCEEQSSDEGAGFLTEPENHAGDSGGSHR